MLEQNGFLPWCPQARWCSWHQVLQLGPELVQQWVILSDKLFLRENSTDEIRRWRLLSLGRCLLLFSSILTSLNENWSTVWANPLSFNFWIFLNLFYLRLKWPIKEYLRCSALKARGFWGLIVRNSELCLLFGSLESLPRLCSSHTLADPSLKLLRFLTEYFSSDLWHLTRSSLLLWNQGIYHQAVTEVE